MAAPSISAGIPLLRAGVAGSQTVLDYVAASRRFPEPDIATMPAWPSEGSLVGCAGLCNHP